jgi:hypothetical protein
VSVRGLLRPVVERSFAGRRAERARLRFGRQRNLLPARAGRHQAARRWRLVGSDGKMGRSSFRRAETREQESEPRVLGRVSLGRQPSTAGRFGPGRLRESATVIHSRTCSSEVSVTSRSLCSADGGP